MTRKELISDTLAYFERQGFSKTIDAISEYSPNADLYYRKIGGSKYIVINHFNKKQRFDLQGFDCWLSEYSTESEIGKKSALKIDSIVLSFRLDQDQTLLESYFS